MGSLIGHRTDYNGVGVLRGQRHIPSKNQPRYTHPTPPPPRCAHDSDVYGQCNALVIIIEEIRKAVEMMAMNLEDLSKGLIQDELLSGPKNQNVI